MSKKGDKVRKYILENQTPVRETNLLRWAHWMEAADCKVALTEVAHHIRVSTIFLGLDHNFEGKGDPILFETVIFGGSLDGYQRRYKTWTDAVVGHGEATQKARDALKGTAKNATKT